MLEAYSLEIFQTYNATKPDEVINSASEDSARKWIRKASFMQLGYALELHIMDHEVPAEQLVSINKFNEYVFSDEFKKKELVEFADIELVLDILDVLGINTSEQRKQLLSWPK